MLNIFNIETQVCKRVHKYLLQLCQKVNLEISAAKLVINASDETLCIHLYDRQKFIKSQSFQSVADFFGKEYDEKKTEALWKYLERIAKENNLIISNVRIILCEIKGEIGAHVYNETKYVKRLSTLELLTSLY
jgi:hypothetical protein